jgi:diaminopropionate ammonia-lyase
MAHALGIDTLLYKDEGSRFGLGSFKALGGMYGVYRTLLTSLERETGRGDLSSADFSRDPFAQLLSGFTVTCASAGNHGKAVARGAEMFGCRSVVFLPSHTSPHRVKAIRGLGARISLVDGSFDDAVVRAAEEADANGWAVVADTTFPGYEEVPRYIMQGYTILAREVLDQTAGQPLPTHVFLQAGVGGLAAAVTGHLWYSLGVDRPRVIVVEPSEADCFLESALRESPNPAHGTLRTSMECLACRNVSGLAWEILREGADAYLTISDHTAEEAVAALAQGVEGDAPILSQPSGAAGLGGLLAAAMEPTFSEPLGLGKKSRVLVFGSEGPP